MLRSILLASFLWIGAASAQQATPPAPQPPNAVALTGGTIDGVAIGNTTAANGTFLATNAQTMASAGVNHGLYTWSNLTTIAGAGTTLATATTISSGTVKITACAAGTGIKMPAQPSGSLGYSVLILVRSGTTCLLYPNSASGTIEGGAAGNAVTLGIGGSYLMVGDSAIDWLEVTLQ